MNGSTPSALSLSVRKLSGITTNSFLINPTTGSGSVGPSQQIRLLLPTAGFLHLPSTRLYFSLKGVGAGTRFPQWSSSLFSRIQVLCGGVTITSGTSVHNVVECVKNIVGDKRGCAVSEHPFMVQTVDMLGSNFDSATIAGGGAANDPSTAPETYEAGVGKAQVFSIDLGDFFQSLHPEYLDLALIGQIEVVLTTAERSVLSCVKSANNPNTAGDSSMVQDGAGVAASTYTIERPTVIANMVSMLEGIYPTALRQQIADAGFISCYFNEHIAFQQQFAGNARFNLSAMSLNKLHTVFRRAGSTDFKNALSVGGAVPIAGSATSRLGSDSFSGYGWLGAGNLANAGVAKFQGKYQQFKLPASSPVQDAVGDITAGTSLNYNSDTGTGGDPCELQYRINSTQVPNTFLNPAQVAEVTKYANGIKEYENIDSFVEFLFNKFVLSYRFDIVSNPFEPYVVSGLDTRNSNSMVEVVSNGGNVSTTEYDAIVIAELTKEMRIGQGKQVELLS
jgi:hypothetical protein